MLALIDFHFDNSVFTTITMATVLKSSMTKQKSSHAFFFLLM